MSNLSPEWRELRCSLHENLSLLSYQWKINQYIILFTTCATHRVVAYGGPVEGIIPPEPFAMGFIAGFSKGIGICSHRLTWSTASLCGIWCWGTGSKRPIDDDCFDTILDPISSYDGITSRLDRLCSVRKTIEYYPSLRKSSCAPDMFRVSPRHQIPGSTRQKLYFLLYTNQIQATLASYQILDNTALIPLSRKETNQTTSSFNFVFRN